MGVLGLVPADELSATYNPAEQTLTLYAKGEAPKWTYGFDFKRLPWVGGLKYELLAWSGPYVSGTRPYEWSQTFSIPNLTAVDPGGAVDVVTLNYHQGKLVPVHWLGFDPAKDDKAVDSKQDPDATPALPTVIDTPVATINALYKEPFTIKESVVMSPLGFVHIQYSSFALIMTNSSINSGSLVWTFNSLETGKTQVIVDYRNEFGDPILRKVYNVNVFVLENALVASSAVSESKPEITTGLILDFAGRVFIAQRIVQRVWPSAGLILARATLPHGVVYPVTDPLRLSQLSCSFLDEKGTATIASTGWGEYSPPVFTTERRLGMTVIDIQKDIAVDITEAVDLMRKAGISEAFWSAELSHPLVAPGESADEPHYAFHMVSGVYVFVGAKDGNVTVNHSQQNVLPVQGKTVEPSKA